MTFLERIKEFFTRDLALSNEKAWDRTTWNLYRSQSLSGESVNENSALTYSAVWNAVSLISGTVGALPLHLMRRKGKKNEMADNRGLYRIMHDSPNEYMTAMSFREAMMAHVLLWGNGYAEIVRNGMGEIDSLWPITPDRVSLYMADGELWYVVRVGNEDVYLHSRKVLHIPGLGFDGFQGYSVVGMANKSLGLGMALETFGSLYFGSGTHPGTIVSHPQKLSDTAHKNLEQSLVNAYTGLGQSHRLMLLEEGMKIEQVGIPPDDSQFLETRQFQIPEVARWFNLPPHKLKDLTKSSFNNIESEQISFVTDSILPWLVRLEQNYNMQLLLPNEQSRQRLYFKHSVEGLLRGDSASRGDFYSKMFGIGAYTINDIRALEDKDPATNEFADEHFVPMNMVPLSMVEKQFEKEEPPPPVTPPTPALPTGEEDDA